MREWLMENGDRTSVMGDFAYDTDNDAWCELGSSEGSTPVWWRGRGWSRGGSQGQPSKADLSRAIDRCKEELAEARRLEMLEGELEAVQKKCAMPYDAADAMGDLNWISAIGGVLFFLTFFQAPEQYSTHVNVITLLIFSPLLISAVSLLIRALRRPAVEANRKRASLIKKEIAAIKSERGAYAKTADQLSEKLKSLEDQLAELAANK